MPNIDAPLSPAAMPSRIGFTTVLLLLLLAACRTAPPAPLDLSQPGWRIREGQAVWTAAQGERPVAGELLLALGPDDACWVQFSKPPFTLAAARRDVGRWSVERPQLRQFVAGRGTAPPDVLWFQLANALAIESVAEGWQFEDLDDGSWTLANPRTGERLEGFLSP
ncbi:MAG: hypothetical protein ACYDC1_21440 [Limisphaerales bacterium]